MFSDNEWSIQDYHHEGRFLVAITVHSHEQFWSIDLRELETWAIRKLADMTGFAGLISRVVEFIQFDIVNREIKVYLREYRRDD